MSNRGEKKGKEEGRERGSGGRVTAKSGGSIRSTDEKVVCSANGDGK